MTDALPDVELLNPTRWWVLRSTRLRALRDSPHAYTSTHAVESAWESEQWQDQLATGTWAVALDQGQRIGVAGLVWPVTEPPHVEWAWVAPSHRRQGVLRSLIAVLVAEARKAGPPSLMLWVLKDNTDALAAYQKLGFMETGEEQPIRSADGLPAGPEPRSEVRLQLEL
jgi:ribosomal protein S18 acetylase RimI-like enzyme